MSPRRFIPACAGNTSAHPPMALRHAVHPRVRGEHRLILGALVVVAGSSPRARGTRREPSRRDARRRFIPACAGNTERSASLSRSQTVHPRVRGEHGCRPCPSSRLRGSSPRARGTRPETLFPCRCGRFIPACAGNTCPIWASHVAASVHPRVRGEHSRALTRFRIGNGSSPRARGTLLRRYLIPPFSRFIPACAGNTSPRGRSLGACSVHPRVRGEHGRARRSYLADCGSSPRARGTPVRKRVRARGFRFIPACAGNTNVANKSGKFRPVHPRVRGEHATRTPTGARMTGSSPRARGTRPQEWRDGVIRRFIPACAGNTRRSTSEASLQPVHPRVRGEHQIRAARTSPTIGSSPRARGTPGRDRRPASVDRFIPACAGNTRRSTSEASLQPVHPRVRGEHQIRAARTSPTIGSSPRARGTPGRDRRPASVDRFIPACAGNTKIDPEYREQVAVHPRVRGEHFLRSRSSS